MRLALRLPPDVMLQPSQDPPAPPTPPMPPQDLPASAPEQGGAGGQGGGENVVVFRQGASSPISQLEAMRAQRDELGNQLERLRDRRNAITNELGNGQTVGADRAGLETQLKGIDARIVEVDQAISAADLAVSQAAAVPGAVSGLRDQERARRREDEQGDIPEEFFVLGGMMIAVIGIPLSIAYARRIWRRGATAVTALPAELMERMSRVEQGVESIAIEVERIGEGQRFMTRVLGEGAAGRAIGSAPAEPIRHPVREAAALRTDER